MGNLMRQELNTSPRRIRIPIYSGTTTEAIALAFAWIIVLCGFAFIQPTDSQPRLPRALLDATNRSTSPQGRAKPVPEIVWALRFVDAPCNNDDQPRQRESIHRVDEDKLHGQAYAWLSEAESLQRHEWKYQAGLRFAAGALLSLRPTAAPGQLETAADAYYSAAIQYSQNGQASAAHCAFEKAAIAYERILASAEKLSELHGRASRKRNKVPIPLDHDISIDTSAGR